MGGGPIDPTQILAGAQNLPNQFQPPQQPASMTPQVQNPGAMPGGDLQNQMLQSQVQSTEQGQQAFQAGQQRLADLGARADALQQRLGQIPLPKTGVTQEPWMKMQPVHGQGVGGDLKNLLSDIGRGMLAGVGATGPGRAIQQGLYGPGERAYQRESGSLAQQISDIQKQQESTNQGMGAAASMASKPALGYGAVQRGTAAIDRVALQRQMEPAKLEIERQGQQLQRDIAAGKLTAEQARTQIMAKIAQMHDSTIQSIAGMYSDQRDRDAAVQAGEQEYKIQSEDWLQRLFGTAPQAPSQSPTPMPGPKSTGTKPNQPKKAASSGVQEGATATGPNNHKIKFTGGRWVDAATGKPIQ